MSKAINKLNEKEKEKEKIRLLFAQREKFYRILENPEQGFTPPTALLKSGETCFLIDYVNMGEVVTERVRTYTGTRLKLGSTPVYLGGGKSVANEKQKNVAYGELVLTNFRLIFVGNMRSIDLPLDKINSVECFQSSIRISQSGKNKPIFFNTVFNPQLWKEAILVLSDKKSDGPCGAGLHISQNPLHVQGVCFIFPLTRCRNLFYNGNHSVNVIFSYL